MSSRTAPYPLALVSLSVLLVFLAAGGPAVADEDPSLLPPESTWTMQGGNPGRNAATRTSPLKGPLEIAWRHEFDGEVVGEPLLWNDRIVVEVKISSERRAIHMLDLLTGKRRGSPLALKTELPLIPALWRNRIVLRSKPHEFRVYRIGRQRLSLIWKRKEAVDSLMIVDKEVTFDTGHSPKACEDGTGEARGIGYGSLESPVVRDRHNAHWLTYDGEGRAMLHTGHGDPLAIGHHEGGSLGIGAMPVLCGNDLFVKLGLPVPLQGGGTADTVWLQRSRGVAPWKVRNYLSTKGVPCGSHERWIARLRDPKGRYNLVLTSAGGVGAGRGRVLASDDIHPELLEFDHMSIARNVLYLGSARVDLETMDIYEPMPIVPHGRAIPARDSILALEGPRVLISMREKRVEEDLDERIRPSGATAEPASGTVVDREGRIKKCKLAWTEGAVTINGKPPKDDQILVARAKDGTIAWAASPRHALSGIAYLIRAREGPGYAGLATAAVKALDADLARRYAAAAEDGGAGKRVTKWTRGRIRSLAEDVPRKKPKADAVEAVLADERALRRSTTDLIWDSCEKLGQDASWPVRGEFLRAVIERVPDHEGAVAAVKAAIPPGVPLPKSFDASEWLLLADAVRTDPVRPADPKGPSLLAFEFAKITWRRDVIGLRSENLLILTPEANPAQIAACLATGELVCRTLADLFGTPPKGDAPLVLHLFPTREGYLKAAGMGRPGNADKHAEASTGHYVPALGLSRIFLPTGDDPFERVHKTYAHELVHHWMDARCPLPRTGGRRGYDERTPGFWLVEGVAELFAEFDYDLRRGRVDTGNRRAASLDMIAHAPPGRSLPWDDLLTLNQSTFARLSVTDEVQVPTRWRVGLHRKVTQTGMFYAQAAATAQYLFHESAKTKTALVELIRRYYEGTLSRGDLERIAGLTRTALGRSVAAYAKR